MNADVPGYGYHGHFPTFGYIIYSAKPPFVAIETR